MAKKAMTINANIAIMSLFSTFSLVYILAYSWMIHGLLLSSHSNYSFKLLQYKLHNCETTSDLFTFSVICRLITGDPNDYEGPFCGHECDAVCHQMLLN